MSNKGMSKPVFRESGYSVNQEIYLNECIKKKIIPFIEKYYFDSEFIFWPNLAASHYAKTIVYYMGDKNFDFMKKEDIPENLPEIRPVFSNWE